MIWLGLNLIIVASLAGLVSALVLILSKSSGAKPNGIALSAVSVVGSVLVLLALTMVIQQFVHVAPLEGSFHLALGTLVVLVAAPIWIAVLKSKVLSNG